MIVTYPLIVSKTVNPNILPGVCKALEKYVYVYKIDGVIDAANRSIALQNAKSNTFIALQNIGNRMSLKLENAESDKCIGDYITEDWDLENWYTDDEILSEAKPKSQTQTMVQGPIDPVTGNRTTTTTSPIPPSPPSPHKPKEIDPYKDAQAKERGKQSVQKTEPKIGRMDSDSISTEPTWNTVTDQQGNTKAIGVKVIPFVIDNEESLVKLMTIDRYRNKLSKNVHVQARKILRFMHRLANATWKRTIGLMFSWTGFVDKDLQAGTVTKNWKNDIILQNTAFKKNMFILLNKMDLEEDFTQSASGVKKLFRLGWTSFIIADDINKVVHFCMDEYKGMCSMVNYGFLYADARSQSQVYADIEDVRKSAGPLFRMKRRKKSMITDNLAKEKLDKYSQDILLSESSLNESVLPDLLKKIKDNPASMVSDLKAITSAFRRKDYKKASMIAKKFNPGNKNVDVNKAIDKAKNVDKEYKKNFDLAFRVFKNSLPQLDDTTLKMGSGLLASMATMNKNKNYNFKNDLKKVVLNTRSKAKTLEEDNDDFANDLKVAFVFALLGLFFMGGGITIILYFLAQAAPVVGGALYAAWPVIVTIGSILLALNIMAKAMEGGKDD